eukprot:g4788.t1 g4788   contig17:30441-31992(+)
MKFSFVSFLAAVFSSPPSTPLFGGSSSVKSPLFVTKPIIYGLDILLLQHAVCALAGFEDDVLGVKKLPIASKAKVVNRYTGSTVSRRNIVDAADVDIINNNNNNNGDTVSAISTNGFQSDVLGVHPPGTGTPITSNTSHHQSPRRRSLTSTDSIINALNDDVANGILKPSVTMVVDGVDSAAGTGTGTDVSVGGIGQADFGSGGFEASPSDAFNINVVAGLHFGDLPLRFNHDHNDNVNHQDQDMETLEDKIKEVSILRRLSEDHPNSIEDEDVIHIESDHLMLDDRGDAVTKAKLRSKASKKKKKKKKKKDKSKTSKKKRSKHNDTTIVSSSAACCVTVGVCLLHSNCMLVNEASIIPCILCIHAFASLFIANSLSHS